MGLPPGLLSSLGGVAGLGALGGGGNVFGQGTVPAGGPPAGELSEGEAKELRELKDFIDTLAKSEIGKQYLSSLGPGAGMLYAVLCTMFSVLRCLIAVCVQILAWLN
jgi:hypothetical protein